MTGSCDLSVPSRRALLAAGVSFAAWAARPRLASAAGTRDPRLVVIVLRGALDGLAAVGPLGDPDYARLHGDLALAADGIRPALALDGFFGLNPAMPELARMWRAGQAAIVHAVATNYRERSHFDGQDVLESGQPGPGRTQSGWLNRALSRLDTAGRASPLRGLGVGPTTPLILRGPAPVLGWTPQILASAGDDLAKRILALYDHRDPELGRALRDGLDTDAMAKRGGLSGDMGKARGGMDQPTGMRQAALGTARLLAAAEGPRVAALAFDGWDTHASEGALGGQLANRLGGLDGALAAFESELGPAWADTAIAVVTEFGRTVRINGTTGTDHGTGTVAFLVGGAIRGRRVIADWPGLADDRLYQNRDLKPTTDLRAVFAGLLVDHLGVSPTAIADEVFPDGGLLKPMAGLIV
ncbi:DUF1501 domain-containing protein [Siculibacillus lacustris]|uniref:DUF1501 domain-containing protein n=2 Tax=Siculibacillus lacustris TaxID=1549641 RepID=A0A4Q9VVX8_9HYPH|nr:DUF1501 domain-containing protein [Siculibacillus lacustris]TBW40340.1 DUF1501 domain-containing protein [Siculibacillus lacustris]